MVSIPVFPDLVAFFSSLSFHPCYPFFILSLPGPQLVNSESKFNWWSQGSGLSMLLLILSKMRITAFQMEFLWVLNTLSWTSISMGHLLLCHREQMCFPFYCNIQICFLFYLSCSKDSLVTLLCSWSSKLHGEKKKKWTLRIIKHFIS